MSGQALVALLDESAGLWTIDINFHDGAPTERYEHQPWSAVSSWLDARDDGIYDPPITVSYSSEATFYTPR